MVCQSVQLLQEMKSSMTAQTSGSARQFSLAEASPSFPSAPTRASASESAAQLSLPEALSPPAPVTQTTLPPLPSLEVELPSNDRLYGGFTKVE